MAAGLGTRFRTKTSVKPKGFIQVGGISMIERSVEILLECGIQKILIGTGHIKEMYEEFSSGYTEIQCVYSEKFASTNSMWTLWILGKAIGNEDFLLLESDLIFERRAITGLINCPHENVMLCADVTKFQDSYFIEYDDNNYLVNCSLNQKELKVSGELVGIHKISNSLYKNLYRYYSSVKDDLPGMGYEFALLHLVKNNNIYVLKIPGLKWYEIDDEKDLKYAEQYIVDYI